MTNSPPSPFAEAAPDLMARGFSVIPIIPAHVPHKGAGKAPGRHVSGGWQGMPGWTRFKDTSPSAFELGMWMRAPGAGVGLLCGTPAGGLPDGTQLVVVGIDVDCDGDDLDTILRVLPASGMAKVGNVGRTIFVRAPVGMVSKSYDRAPTAEAKASRLVDWLAGGRQTVVPGSRHKVTGQPYVWLAGPCSPEQLPIFTEENLVELEETLEGLGWTPEASSVRTPVDHVPAHRDRGCYADDFARANGEGIARLGEWFADLGLPKTAQTRPGVWSAVPVWRESGTGRPIEQRKANLSASSGSGGTPAGVRDWGASGPDATMTAIDLVMRALGLDSVAAMHWLTEKLDLDADEDGVVIDLAAFAASAKTATPPPAPDGDGANDGAPTVASRAVDTMPNAETDATHGEFPEHLLDCPGVVGDIAAWMTRTAPRPLPAANLLTALAVVGTAAGRRFCGPTESGTAIYGLALAPSGSGKAHPIRAAQHIMRKAGLGMMIAPSSWMSGSALIQHLGRQPCCMTQADEVGEFFAKLNGAKASPHERAISGVLRELFGINWGSYTTPGWAGSNAAASVPPVIHAPAYSFVGYSVPEAVWEAMQGADVTNGMLNRFILVPSLIAGAEQDDPESVFDVPDDLVASLRAITEVGGPLVSATMHSDMATEPLCRVPWVGGKGGDAAALFRELRRHCQEHPAGEHLMKRTAEIAIRLATVRAIGRAGQRAAVTLDDMDWGRNVALFSADRMIHDASAYMSETEWQQKALGILRIIREAPGGAITKTKLYQRLNHKYKSAEVKAIIDGLQETCQVTANSVRTGERGPPSIIYQAV